MEKRNTFFSSDTSRVNLGRYLTIFACSSKFGRGGAYISETKCQESHHFEKRNLIRRLRRTLTRDLSNVRGNKDIPRDGLELACSLTMTVSTTIFPAFI